MTEEIRLSDGKVVRRCACRGWILAEPYPSDRTAEAVREHQLEEPHKSWRYWNWRQRNTAKVDVVLKKVE